MEKSFRDTENKEGPRRVSEKGSRTTFTSLIFVESIYCEQNTFQEFVANRDS